MKMKVLTLFTCLLLLAAFSIPVMQYNMSTPVMQNTIFSQIATTVSKGGSIELEVKVNNAVGRSIAVTLNESYIFVGGANITNTTSGATEPILWKFNDLGEQEWNTTLDVSATGDIFWDDVSFGRVAISPDNSSVYAVGAVPSNSYYEPILVKFDASYGGSPIWNYTLKGGEYDRFSAIEVSRDSKTVYIAGTRSNASIYFSSPSMFYVAAINATDGTLKPGWPYTIFLNGTYDISLANDLALSPSDDKLYVSGYYSVVNETKAIKLVALDTSTGSHLWNVTSGVGGKFSAIDISGDGKKIYALEDTSMFTGFPYYYYIPIFPGPYKSLITINTSDGAIIEKLPLSPEPSMIPVFLFTYSGSLSLSFNESKLYATANQLPVFLYTYATLMVELDFSGTVTGAILAPSSQMMPCDLVPANDNESVYVVGYRFNFVYGLVPIFDSSMFLLKGSPGPIPTSPFLILLLLSIYQSLAQQMTYPYIIVGVVAAVVVIVAISLLLIKKLGG